MLEDERLTCYGLELVAQADLDLERWLVRLTKNRLGNLYTEARIIAVARLVADEIVAQLRELVLLDIDQQSTTPLSIVRSNLAPVTSLMVELGAQEPARDSDSRRLYPEDIFGLAPGSLEDISPELQVAGIGWGAAKAHVHLRRRAE